MDQIGLNLIQIDQTILSLRSILSCPLSTFTSDLGLNPCQSCSLFFFTSQFVLFYRSGSSLVGSILSAKSTSTYLFEPYHWKHFNHKNGSKLDLHFVKVEEKFISDFTNGLFDCNKVRHFVFPKAFSYISQGLICTFFPFELYLSLS